MSPGTQLGPYIVLSSIGSGGMGEVWKARDTRLDRIVAIKTLKGQHTARFEQEARAIAALNHPHICQIYDIGPDYLVLEYVEGLPLKGPLPAEQAWTLARQIASALEAAHAKGILHRDLKPGNILVSSSGAKLLDFGLAKLMDDADATQTMGIAGTPLYMSPEQVEGKPLDARSDIFSFGVVLYELLTGRRPFDSLASVLRDDPAPAGHDVVTRCLAKQPVQRFDSMTRVLAALREIEAKPVSTPPSIAVLPFANMSRDADDEYFSDGLAEEIINALVKVPGLKVIARTSAFSFKGQNIDIRKIAETLGVSTVLEGSVRRAGNRIRVTAQLITAADGTHLWSERYDREMADVFAVQDEISAAITGALQVKLSTSADAKPRYTPKLDAYEAVLRGRREMQRWTPASLEHARELYQRAIELDPDYALARCALATNFFSMATEQVIPPREAAVMMNRLAHEALSISSKQGEHDLSEAHAVLGLAATLNYEWDLGAHYFRLAFRDNPPSPMMRIYHSMLFLASVGRSQEALAQLEFLLPEDPLNQLLRVQIGLMGTEAFAEQRMLRLLETDPDDWIASMFLAGCYVRQRDLAKARTYAERSYALYPAHHGNVGCFAAILSLTGEGERAARLLRELGPDEAGGAPSGWVAYHMGRGETALAAAWMEKVIDQRDTRAPYLLPRCYWPDIRTSEYWPALARRMNLTEGQ